MNEVVEIPPELKIKMREIILHMDVVWVSNCMFLTSIAKPIFYRDAQPIEDKSDKSFYKALDKTIRMLNGAGCRVTII